MPCSITAIEERLLVKQSNQKLGKSVILRMTAADVKEEVQSTRLSTFARY